MDSNQFTVSHIIEIYVYQKPDYNIYKFLISHLFCRRIAYL